MNRFVYLFLVWICVLLPKFSQAGEVSFNRDIRPILSETCFVCHGPDEAELQGGLRLDVREKAIGETDSGEHAIVPGDSAASQLIARITSEDADERMPPADFGKVITPPQIELLKKWIKEGAEYEGHWAFTAPAKPDVPKVANEWSRNPIDEFVFQRVHASGLDVSREADRSTLIRRVTLDLTGVPPTGAEVDAFLSDRSDDAYEKLVDRLLTSTKYGERMAISWLDFARYADSNGFQSDGSRTLWAWRDWLINALNENKPFDQFTVEQLAGDMLPDATRDQIIATGFNRNHRLNGEGGRIVDEWFVETVIDRVETTGLTWLGLTFNCCRCHDHKYDPISQREFYQMFAFFNSNDETGVLSANGKNGDNTPPLLTMSTPEQAAKLAALRKVEADAVALAKRLNTTTPKRLADWEASEVLEEEEAATWSPLAGNFESIGGAEFKTLDDGSVLVHGKNPPFDAYTVTAPVDVKSLSGLMLQVFPHESLAQKGFGRSGNGNFVLTQVNATIQTSDGRSLPITFDRAEADFEQPGWTAESMRAKQHANLKDGSKSKGWAVAGNEKANRVPRKLVLVCNEPVECPPGAQLQVTMTHASPYKGHNIGCFQISVSDDPPAELKATAISVPANISLILGKAANERDAGEAKVLRQYFAKNHDHELINATNDRAAATKAATEFEKRIPSTMVMKERDEPRDAFILVRGEYDKPGEKVERGLPAALPPLPEGQPLNRLGLANWIVDESNPLTARVWVNRAWEHFFGVGLCKTTENFGSQADYPSHPALLDWLATEFMSPTSLPSVAGEQPHSWDMKAVHKLMVMSATYRQSSDTTPDLIELDPENRLYARGPRFRLTGELIRDSALAVSGLLVDRVGGPSVRPYMPEKVWDETSVYGNLRNYKHDQGDGLYRRTMYTIWKRTAAPPTMLLFDAPNREVCTIKRSRTNTPLQALSLLNEVTFVEAARSLAARMIVQGGKDADSRLRFAYKNLFSREPTADELLMLTAGIEADFVHFANDADAAKSLVSIGEWKPSHDVDPIEWAAYTMAANVLLNLDEFVTRP